MVAAGVEQVAHGVAQAVQGALAGHKPGRHGDRTRDRDGKRLRGWVEG